MAAIAAALADRLGLTAIEVPLAIFPRTAPSPPRAATVSWMPVVRLATDLGDAASLGRAGRIFPACVLAGTHGAVEGDG